MNNWLSFPLIIIVLVAIAAATGWFVNGFYDGNAETMSVKFRVYDLVLLTFVTPLSLITFLLARTGRVAPKMFLLGILIYLAFSYGVSVFNCYQNQLFLVYVAIFSLCSIASFLGFVDMTDGIQELSNLKLMKIAAVILLLIAVSGYRFWLTDAVIAIIKGGLSPSVVGMNLPVNAAQVLDIGFMLPLTIFGAIKLWHSQPLGLVISTATLVFFVLISISVIVMEIGLKLNGFEMDPGKLYGFGATIIMSSVITILIYRAIISMS
jgi:hypothetical protein